MQKKSLSLASDGAKVTNNIQQCVCGIKVNNMAAKDPITKEHVSPQTRNICWPLLFFIGQENKVMYDKHIKPLYSWWEQASQADKDGSSKKIKDLKPFEITSTSDMSAT